jgi:hypothetical protein
LLVSLFGGLALPKKAIIDSKKKTI